MVLKPCISSVCVIFVWEWCKNVWYSNFTLVLVTFAIVWEWCKNVWYSNISKVVPRRNAVWEWCKNVWYSNWNSVWYPEVLFENDVKMYGTQTISWNQMTVPLFENDVKMYGTQTVPPNIALLAPVWEWCKNVWYSNHCAADGTAALFENDVKMYGTQTPCHRIHDGEWFENDVKMYGTQTAPRIDSSSICLRMM